PADALGGSLNLVSKSAFEYKNPEFTYRVLASMNSYAQTLGATPGLGSDHDSRKILPSFDFTYALPLNKQIGITVSFLDSNIFNPQYRSNPMWTPNGTLALFTGAAASLPTQPFLQKYTMQDGPKLTHRKAGEVTLDFKVTPDDVVSIRFQDNKYDNSFGNRNINFDLGSNMPATYGPDFTNGALGKGKVNFGSSFRHKFGITTNAGADYTHTGSDWVFNVGMNYSHASSHYTDAEDGYFSAVTYQLSNVTVNYADYNGVAPQKITVLDKTGKDTIGNVFDVRNPNYVITKVEDNPVLAYDSFVTEQASFKKNFDWKLPTSVKIGGQLQFERRDILNYKVDWTPAGALAKAGAVNAFDLADNVYNVAPPYIPYSVVWPSEAKLYSLYQSNPGLFTPTTAANQQQRVLGSMLFKELISAIYLMGDTHALDDRLQFVYGVRVERTGDKGYGPLVKTTSSGTQYIERGSFSTDDYTGAYPSITSTFKFTDNLLLRASYNRAVGRPDLGNLVPNVVLPDSTLPNQVISVSNPTLAPEQANNYDLSLEYYFQHVGVVSAGVFRKDFSNFWGTQNLTGANALSVLNSLGVPNAQDFLNNGDLVNTVVNAGQAHVTGVEFNYRQTLDNVASWTKGVTVFANATAINLDGAPNADFSAFVSRSVNWGVAYDNQRLSAQVNFNYRGRERDAPTIVNGISYGEFFAPRMYIDANLDIRINRHFGFFINGRNLTNVPQDDQRYADGVTPDYAKLYRREKFGTAYTMGVKGTF
ncbi:MAG TPA: TonB-dependent receptor, partial [Opitutaceae bacterium]